MKRISSTLISNVLNDKYCPVQVKAIYIDKSHRSEATKPQAMGLLFENRVLGSKPGREEYVVPPEFRIKGGKEPSTDEIRVLEQAEFFKNEVLPRYNIKLEESEAYRRFEIEFKDDDIMLTGEFDLLTMLDDPEYGTIPAIVDLKTTKNINYERLDDSGTWSWRYPYNRDHTQAFMYYYAYRLLFGKKDPKFYYFVADYKKTPEHRVFRKKIDSGDLMELKNSIQNTAKTIDIYNDKGWPYKPSFQNCKNCPLKDTCKYAVERPPIQEV